LGIQEGSFVGLVLLELLGFLSIHIPLESSDFGKGIKFDSDKPRRDRRIGVSREADIAMGIPMDDDWRETLSA